MSRGVTSRLAAAGAGTVLSGALLFGTAGTAQAAPTAAPVLPTVSTQAVAPAAAVNAEPTWRGGCYRVWHRPGWSWDHGHRHWHRGYWTCGRRWHR